jgi:hypothetical protein
MMLEPPFAHANPYHSNLLAEMGQVRVKDRPPHMRIRPDGDLIMSISMAALLKVNCLFPIVITHSS